MMLPAELKQIAGKNTRRDLIICLAYCDGFSPEQIVERKKLNLTPTRVQQIVSRNRAFVVPRMGWDSTKKKNFLLSNIHKNPVSKKDPADLLTQISQIEREEKGTDVPATAQFQLVQIFQGVRKQEAIELEEGKGQLEVLFSQKFLETKREEPSNGNGVNP